MLANRRFEMMAEDGKRLFADGQKFIEAGTHVLSNGFSGKEDAVSAHRPIGTRADGHCCSRRDVRLAPAGRSLVVIVSA